MQALYLVRNPDDEASAMKFAMTQLRQEHREMLILVAIQSMTYEQVSETLQMPVTAVRERMAAARASLESLMNAAYDRVRKPPNAVPSFVPDWILPDFAAGGMAKAA